MVTTGDMESMKQERTALKKKVTTLAKRLRSNAASEERILSSQEMESAVKDMKEAYLDFLSIQDEYQSAIEEDPTHDAEFSTVNGQNLEEYSTSVKTLYNDVMAQYKQSAASRKLRKLVKSTVKEAKRQIDNIHPRVSQILQGEIGEEEIFELEYDLEQLQESAAKLRGMRAQVEEGSDLDDEETEIAELIQPTESYIKKISLALKKEKVSKADSVDTSSKNIISTSEGGGDESESDSAQDDTSGAATPHTASEIASPQTTPTSTSALTTSAEATPHTPTCTASEITSPGAPLQTTYTSTFPHSPYPGFPMRDTSIQSPYPGFLTQNASIQSPPGFPMLNTSPSVTLQSPTGLPLQTTAPGAPSTGNPMQSTSADTSPSSPFHMGSLMNSLPGGGSNVVSSTISSPMNSLNSVNPSSIITSNILSTSCYPAHASVASTSTGNIYSSVASGGNPYQFPMTSGYQLPPFMSQVPPHQSLPPGHLGSAEVKVKRTSLPKFAGDRPGWPEFRVLWPKLAVPAFRQQPEALAKELRDCLDGDARKLVNTISITGPDAIDRMWGRLVQYYDDPAASVNAALKKLNGLRSIREEDFRGLVHFVDEVESAYSQLTTWDQKQCLTQLHVENLIKLLPFSVKTRWLLCYEQLDMARKIHPFPWFMVFLERERNMFAREADKQSRQSKVVSHAAYQGERRENGRDDRKRGNSNQKSPCVVHNQGVVKHKTEDCSAFQRMSYREKHVALRRVGACFRCFKPHLKAHCREESPCVKCGDTKHHSLLCKKGNVSSQPDLPTVVTSSSSVHSKAVSLYAIFSVPVDNARKLATVFTDDGSDSSYITNEAAKKLGARKLNKFLLEVTTTGGKETEYESQEYALDLITKSGRKVTVTMFGLEKITGRVSRIDLVTIKKLFPNTDVSTLQRTNTEVDILLGTDHFGLHPKNEVQSAGDNLSLMEGALGLCLQGSHPDLKEEMSMDTNFVQKLKAATPLMMTRESNHSITHIYKIEKNPPSCSAVSHLTHTAESKLFNFIQGEELATQINPKCGACKCAKCPLPGHTYSFEEEAELKLIREGLSYDPSAQVWTARYPWKKDPQTLPDNRNAALAAFYRLKKKLRRDDKLYKVYHEQMVDMVVRGVAREVSPEELAAYKGPYTYINHLIVPNPSSLSTPWRIVFNSSQTYKGASLNDHLCKGPDAYLNNQLGVILRWREEEIAVVGDIRKMYNSVHLETVEQHCHRYLWSELEDPAPKTFVITRVNMGDRPAGAISTEALYMTADRFFLDHPSAATMLKRGSYVDDLMDSVETREAALDLTEGAGKILTKGGFQIKFWLHSGDSLENDSTEVLGIQWYPQNDQVAAKSSLNFSPKKRGIHTLPDLKPEEIPEKIPNILTKRSVLGQVMKIYDPLGLWAPFVLIGKVLLRKTWEKNLGWDDSIPPDLYEKWIQFFISSKELNNLRHPRVLKPADAVGNPLLVIFSDASDVAYGFAAYVRWQLNDDTFSSRLILAKCRVAPLTKRSTPQLELNAAVLAKRGREVILKESRYKFTNFIHIIDSETVLSMLQKTSTRFNIYEGVRIGEIQASTDGDVSCFAWLPGDKNISDWLTRGKNPEEISSDSEWFSGPSYMKKPIEEWGLKFGKPEEEQLLPGEKSVSSHSSVASDPESYLIKYENFSDYERMLRVLARLINIYRVKTDAFKEPLYPELLEKAEKLIVMDAQKSIAQECEKKSRSGKVGGNFQMLKPTKVDDTWVVGTRLTYNPMVPENEPQKLLPAKHPVTKLLMVKAHREGSHRGRDATLARFRQKYWAPQGSKIASSVVTNCQRCKLKKPKMLIQQMGSLPEVRSKPSPPFTHVMVDYMGPFPVRGEVQKRTTGKAWVVVFADLVSRAIHLESVFDYGADSFLLAFNKFASIRGFPREMYSDPGSNLVGASEELRRQWTLLWEEEGSKIISNTAEQGVCWKFSAADAPWQNGAVESMVKSCKKTLSNVMGNQRLSPTQFGAVMYDVANIVNERPIGVTSVDSELSVITPNSLLLGRSTAKNPGGWQPTSGLMKQYHIVQQICSAFWTQWISNVSPGLITDAKWHAQGQNIKPGDVVLVADKSALKSQYKLALVKEVIQSSDGRVRKAQLLYKHYKVGDKLVEYTGSTEQTIFRPVQRLALIVSA